jgi:hypothetical protein
MRESRVPTIKLGTSKLNISVVIMEKGENNKKIMNHKQNVLKPIDFNSRDARLSLQRC